MKKNFFKKLSFVIALAMIISAIAPAAGAFAAESAHLNATKKYLHLSATTGANEYDFNIAHKQKGWKFAWSSSNEDVVSVDPANGLATATGVGSAKVTVAITDKDGADVDTLSADVVVRDNIKTITSVYFQGDAAQDLNKLEPNKGYDFGRKFETEAGSTTKTSSVTRWFVNSDKATIDAAGVFKATEPGTYTITAVAFQSTDKYNAWAALKDTTSTVNVLASKTLDVKVVNDVVKAEQLTATTAKLTFLAPKKDAAIADLKVSMLVGNTKVYQTIKKVTPSEDGLSATVEMYASFNAGTTYVFDYANMTSRQFVGASSNYTDVTRVEVSTTQAEISKAVDVVVKLYNKDNVELTSLNSTLSTRVTLAGTSSKVSLDAANKKVYFFTAGDTISVTATFHTYEYDATGEKGALTASGTIVGVPAAAAATVSSVNAWTIADSAAHANFSSANHLIAAEDAMAYMFVKLVKTNGTDYVDNTGADASKFRFQSSDNSILNVGTSGAVYGIKEGAANVIVTYSTDSFVTDNGKVIGAIPVVVSAKRAATQLTLSANSFTLSNSGVYTETKDVTITLKDQYGTAFGVTSVDVTPAATAPGAVIPYTGKDLTKVSFAGAGRTVGTYAYTVKVNNSLTQMIVVNVAAPSANTSVSYKLSAGTSFDVKLPTSTGAFTVDNTVSVVGYSANGVAYETVTPGALAAAGLSITLTRPNGAQEAVTTGTINLASAVSGAAVTQAATGNYTLTLNKTVSGYTQVIDQVTFTVTNSQSQPSLEVKAEVAPTATTVAAALSECFTVKLDGVEKVVSVDVTKGDYVEVAGSKNVFVKNVRFSVVINGATLEYVVAVNKMITLK